MAFCSVSAEILRFEARACGPRFTSEKRTAIALDELDRDSDLVNVVLELTLETAQSDEIVIDRYALPAH